jgi:ATP-binding protein involved in chromosome partitioning
MNPEQRKPAIYNKEPLAHIKRTIAVASGKGGVGKSTTTICLAHALVAAGKRVGILDADIHGPSIPRMLGIQHSGQPEFKDDQLIPIMGHGIAAMSMGNLSGDKAAIWRGPMVSKALVQMLRVVRWGTEDAPLDVLLIDMPPGTGDIHLSLMQQAPLDGALIVTTPQEIAFADAEKAALMFAKVGVPILGIIENMSWFEAPDGTRHALFGEGGGQKLAEKASAHLLAQIPQAPELQEAVDQGQKPKIANEFAKIATQITK